MVNIQKHNPGKGGTIYLSKVVLENADVLIGDDMKVSHDPNKIGRIILDKK